MTEPQESERLNPFSAALAWVVPGLGHLALGETWRGAAIFVSVMGLFLGGALIGGVDAVDKRQDTWWFVGQAGAGPVAFVVDWKRRDLSAAYARRPNDEPPAYTRSLAHINEIGALSGAIAGMLNLLCIVDAGWRRRRTKAARSGEARDDDPGRAPRAALPLAALGVVALGSVGALLIAGLSMRRPFVDPIELPDGRWWLLLLPMSVGVAMAYKAARAADARSWAAQSSVMALQVAGGIAALAVGMHLLVERFAPFFA